MKIGVIQVLTTTMKPLNQNRMKQETLEDAAERNCESITHPYCEREKSMFIKGAKWMLDKLQDFDTWKEWKDSNI
jgi:hypothetical protein